MIVFVGVLGWRAYGVGLQFFAFLHFIVSLQAFDFFYRRHSRSSSSTKSAHFFHFVGLYNIRTRTSEWLRRGAKWKGSGFTHGGRVTADIDI